MLKATMANEKKTAPILEHDGLPSMICKKCMFLIDSFYCFKQQCESANDKLKNLTQGSKRYEKYNLEDSEDDYVVEYVSDEVKFEVESALKRKREAQKRIDMEKVSRTIKNLKGIEVIPVSTIKTALNWKYGEMIKEEIVVFPAKCEKNVKRDMVSKSNTVEQANLKRPILNDDSIKDSASCEKRLKFVSESSAKMHCDEVIKNEASCNDKKLHFSTVRRVVKINDESFIVNPNDTSDETKKISETEEPLVQIIKTDADSNQNTRDRKSTFYPVQTDVEWDDERHSGIPIPCLKTDTGQVKDSQCQNVQASRSENKVKRENDYLYISQNQKAHVSIEEEDTESQKTQYDHQNCVTTRDNKQQDVAIVGNEVEKEKFYFHPDMTEDDVQVLAQEFHQMQDGQVSDKLSNSTVFSTSVENFITSGHSNDSVLGNTIDISNVDNNNDENDDPSAAITCTTDKKNEVSLEDNDSRCRSENLDEDNTKSLLSSSEDKSKEKDNVGREIMDNVEASMGSVKIVDVGEKMIFNKSVTLSNEVMSPVLCNIKNQKGQAGNVSVDHEENFSVSGLRINRGEDSNGEVLDNVTVRMKAQVGNSELKVLAGSLQFYQCIICKVNFATMPAVLKHNIQKHMTRESSYPCLVCDRIFENKTSLFVHVEEHSSLKPYQCSFCPKTFTLKKNLKRHVEHHINYKPYQCRICTKRFAGKSSLTCHMYLHTGDSPFVCKKCNASFNSKANWRRHVVTIHEKLTAVMCRCCNKELPDKRSLQIHTRTHTGERPYQCPHCDRRFTQQCNLNTHIHCHLDDRPFLCPYCGKGFNQSGTRDDHVLLHTGEKPHKCRDCSARFTVSSALKRHMWIHTDKARPYNCERCNLQFVGFYDLRRHLKLRHKELIALENPRVKKLIRKDEVGDNYDDDVELGKTNLSKGGNGDCDQDRKGERMN